MSFSVNHVAVVTPLAHIWWSASGTQRTSFDSGTPPASGAFESQLNSVAQNCSGWLETMWPAAWAASSTARIFGSSGSETSFGREALCDGEPSVYGLPPQTSNLTGALQVGWSDSERQNRFLMKLSGPQSGSIAVTSGVL